MAGGPFRIRISETQEPAMELVPIGRARPALSRRAFFCAGGGCTAAAVCTWAAPAAFAGDPLRLRLVFTHIDPSRPTWP
jgi:hypothetical protein